MTADGSRNQRSKSQKASSKRNVGSGINEKQNDQQPSMVNGTSAQLKRRAPKIFLKILVLVRTYPVGMFVHFSNFLNFFSRPNLSVPSQLRLRLRFRTTTTTTTTTTYVRAAICQVLSCDYATIYDYSLAIITRVHHRISFNVVHLVFLNIFRKGLSMLTEIVVP